MKQRFKGSILTKKKCVNNILKFYALANVSEVTEGINWYNDAHKYARDLAARFNLSVSQVAGIIAAFSPQTGWQENKRFTLTFLINPKTRVKSLVQDIKAKKMLQLKSESDIYHALSVNDAAWKTKAFFLNILNPDIVTDVTIDRHAIAACLQKPDKVESLSERYSKITKAQYDFLQACYVDAAKQLEILPHQLQAIVWTVYRRLRDLRQHDSTTDWQPFETEISF
jgi:hypothetical protein